MTDSLIQKWLKEKTINKKQATTMRRDLQEQKKEKSANKFITALSIIGATLLGIGAILFVSSNWEAFSNIEKIILLVGSTFFAYILGYYFKYGKKHFPKVGAALIFLATLLFGATIFLIAQMYHINANNHTLLLIWLIGILPLVYAFRSAPIAFVCTTLFYVWIGFYVLRNMEFNTDSANMIAFPVLYLIAGILIFEIGSLHYFNKKFASIARIYRLLSLNVIMVSLFLLTFEVFSGNERAEYILRESHHYSTQFIYGIILFATLATIGTVINRIYNPSKSDTLHLEICTSLGLTAFSLTFFYFVYPTNLFTIAFNLILAAIIIILIYLGYRREDIRLVNLGFTFMGLLIMVRYFDWFWDLLERSAFFMIGGIILIGGGMYLERKRRELKEQFNL